MPEIVISIRSREEYCGECHLRGLNDSHSYTSKWYCRVFDPHALNFLEKVEGGDVKRCEECLEAEKKARRWR